MTNRKKLFIIIVAGAIFLGGIVLFILWLTGNNNSQGSNTKGHSIVIIDNAAQYKNRGLSDDFLNTIEPAVYITVEHNVSNPSDNYHGTIRNGSFTLLSSGAVSFLLDIPSVQLSWYVVQGQSDPSVSCVTQLQANWALPSKCVDLSTILTNESSNTPSLGAISKYLPISDASYTMDSGYSPTDSTKLAILVTCYSATCQQDVVAQIQSLGLNPTDYPIFYTKAY